jgi:hypothetical protein
MRTAVGPRLWGVRREVNDSVMRLVLMGMTLLFAPRVNAQVAAVDSVRTWLVAPGVSHRRIERSAGPWVVNVLEVDLRRPGLAVRGIRACDRLLGRERPSAIAKRLRQESVNVVAVLNADFFDLRGRTGATESNVVIDGEIVKAVRVTESPFDAFDNVHSQFAMTIEGKPVIDRLTLHGVVRTPSGDRPLDAINASDSNGLALLTPWFDSMMVMRVQPDIMVSAALLKVGGRGDTAHYRVDGIPRPGPVREPTEQMTVLVATGDARSVVERLRENDRVTVIAGFRPHRGRLHTIVGGWPRIVTAGHNVALAADSVEGTRPGFSRARHPRSALGIGRDSLTLYLVTVDGRQASSVGMTLEELADQMLALGALEALNFDGGGSTALVVRDSVVNAPSDTSGERPVGNVIAVTYDPPDASAPTGRLPRQANVASCLAPARRQD